MFNHQRLHCERELDWYFNVFPTRIGLSALDPGALVVKANYVGFTDVQIKAVERSLPVHRALVRCTGKDRKVLTLGFTVQAWRVDIDHTDTSPHYDLELVFGKLAGIVRGCRLTGSNAEKKAKASALLTGALARFMKEMT